MPRAISSKWYNDCRCASSFNNTTQIRNPCSSALPLSPTSILTGRRQGPMLVSVCKPPCLNRRRRQPPPLNARRPPNNDRGGSFASQTQGGNEPLGRGRRRSGADLYGGA